MDFLYSLCLKLLYPTSMALGLLMLSAALRRGRRGGGVQSPEGGSRRMAWSTGCFWGAVVMLLGCGNGWLVSGLTRHLEWRHLPPNPVPQADAILVLSGGILPRVAPRPTVEVGEAGDRLLYGAHLYRQGKAPRIICTGNVATGGVTWRPIAEEMAEFLTLLGIERAVIVTEIRSENTHQHAVNLGPVFKEWGFKRVLLVTSAAHMPRAVGVFRKSCPDVDFIPTPTDFHAAESPSVAWYRELSGLIPTPTNLQRFSELEHEYLGLAYYRLRGWL